MAKDNQFQNKVTALAKPRPYGADPLKDPACHESQTTPEGALSLGVLSTNRTCRFAASGSRTKQADEVLRTDRQTGSGVGRRETPPRGSRSPLTERLCWYGRANGTVTVTRWLGTEGPYSVRLWIYSMSKSSSRSRSYRCPIRSWNG
jgi:hypothetical protein